MHCVGDRRPTRPGPRFDGQQDNLITRRIEEHTATSVTPLPLSEMQRHGKRRVQALASRPDNHFGRVAKQADASDLKSGSTKVECGFEPRLGH